jgi:uncharacterized protein YjiS (DUF1127 family)
MIALANTFLHSLSTPLGRVGPILGLAIGNVARRWKQRREVRHLADLDDRMLSDMGVTRSEVVGALAEPTLRDRAASLVGTSSHPNQRQ